MVAFCFFSGNGRWHGQTLVVWCAALLLTIASCSDPASEVGAHDPADDDQVQVFTHFPFDLEEAFANPDELWTSGAVHANHLPIMVYFNPPHKTTSARKWYFLHPRYETDYSLEFDTAISDWKVYLVADAVLTDDEITVWADRDGNKLDGVPYRELDPDLLPRDEVDGDPVFLGTEVVFKVGPHIGVHYEKLRLRQEVVETVVAAGGTAEFAAGTHIGYGANGLTVWDERVDAGNWFKSVNPFDYLVDDLQAELLAYFAPLYEWMEDEGIHPFRDMTASHIYWDKAGTMEGAWTNNDMAGHGVEDTDWWVHISLVGFDYIDPRTYWRVLQHPWNAENNFSGIYIENTVPFRFYLLDGDMSNGVAMLIQEQDTGDGPVWRPQERDSAENHPSIGHRQYIRFEVLPADHLWDEELTIEKFSSAEDAGAGFTEAAVVYLRGFHYADH